MESRCAGDLSNLSDIGQTPGATSSAPRPNGNTHSVAVCPRRVAFRRKIALTGPQLRLRDSAEADAQRARPLGARVRPAALGRGPLLRPKALLVSASGAPSPLAPPPAPAAPLLALLLRQLLVLREPGHRRFPLSPRSCEAGLSCPNLLQSLDRSQPGIGICLLRAKFPSISAHLLGHAQPSSCIHQLLPLPGARREAPR